MKRLYAVKRRPDTQPVILLVAQPEQVGEWAIVTPEGQRLMERFWPGALTLVFPRRLGGLTVGARLETLAFRAPDHPVALALLRALREPIASSSANRTGAPPAADADAVLAGLEGEVDLVLDAGKTPLAEASTILDMSGPTPRVLRQGHIPERELIGSS